MELDGQFRQLVKCQVVGGVSDGFVLDDNASPEFFIALDKAGGDLAGLECFHGRGIARELQQAGKETLSAEFMCDPGKFFGNLTAK